jgi:trimeric autotransporter adhesin
MFCDQLTVTSAIFCDSITSPHKHFLIDHPCDPANRYLYHSSVESPEMINVYSGNVTTDQNGKATVILPDYFEALNGDYRYQLTVIGQLAHAVVETEISDNRFGIKTDKPHVKVSWQVSGIRRDAYAKAHPVTVDQEKPLAERGFFLHPQVHGQPENKGIAERRRRLKEVA